MANLIHNELTIADGATFEFPEDVKGQGRITGRIGRNAEVIFHGIDVFLTRLHLEIKDNCRLVVGKSAIFNKQTNFDMNEPGASIIIGEGCMFSRSRFWTSDFHGIYDATTGNRLNHTRDIMIGDRCWVGNDVLVLKGTEMGNDTVIAAGSVVSGKKFGSNLVIGGNPAKVIKEGIIWHHKKQDIHPDFE
ncbi:hypothetical protein [uncultured Cohaesibacter sp.]|uniref:acyltransferase n=1 Tax=uncultured Cohaesibacter sp. TaxID=1002546 RepID=UPI0029C6C33E|nr:hypothetical protein [uncultured Cohaesibacter sp.]